MIKSRIRIILLSGSILITLIVGGIFFINPFQEQKVLKVFHAGSLTIPFEDIEFIFEKNNPNVDIQLQSAGSVQCVSKITEARKIPDVLAVADWTLIKNMPLIYQHYYIKFAVNQMVLAFINDTAQDAIINKNNFYNILRSSGFGISNPNLDPCGYRSLIVLQLAEFAYNDSLILDNLVLSHTTVTELTLDGNSTIYTPENLNPDNFITIRDKSVDLITMVKEGSLPYAFEYRSVAVQHGLDYIELDDMIDLSNANNDDFYRRVKVVRKSGVSEGKSITYGITIPNNANEFDLAALFVEFVINEIGDFILSISGQPPINPARASPYIFLPANLKPYCIEDKS